MVANGDAVVVEFCEAQVHGQVAVGRRSEVECLVFLKQLLGA